MKDSSPIRKPMWFIITTDIELGENLNVCMCNYVIILGDTPSVAIYDEFAIGKSLMLETVKPPNGEKLSCSCIRSDSSDLLVYCTCDEFLFLLNLQVCL